MLLHCCCAPISGGTHGCNDGVIVLSAWVGKAYDWMAEYAFQPVLVPSDLPPCRLDVGMKHAAVVCGVATNLDKAALV